MGVIKELVELGAGGGAEGLLEGHSSWRGEWSIPEKW